MERQVGQGTAGDDGHFRGDAGGPSDISGWGHPKASLLPEAEADGLLPSCSESSSGGLGLPPEPQCAQEGSSPMASSKVSAYYQRWNSSIPGVYIPVGPSRNLQRDGERLKLQALVHLEESEGLREEDEENFIILVDTVDDENLPPALGKALPNQCKKHGQTLQEVGRLQEHKHLHVSRSSYKCPLCDKEFFRAANLRMHKLTHSTDRPHKCPVCNKGFIRTADVWRHLHSFHKIERSSVVLGSANIKNQWSVQQQNQEENWKPELLGSASQNPGEPSLKCYLCAICNKAFRKANLLSKHKVIHRQEKPYVCQECGMAFVQMARLKRHNWTHSGERPFACKDCGGTFTRLGSLQRHQRIHTGERPYSCASCGLSFVESGTLKRHERIHTVVQP
ncbi:Zinc finger protein 92 [Varanus komodoensis]|nr:Zinc finger protein 92 [Varanus komodoensis]